MCFCHYCGLNVSYRQAHSRRRMLYVEKGLSMSAALSLCFFRSAVLAGIISPDKITICGDISGQRWAERINISGGLVDGYDAAVQVLLTPHSPSAPDTSTASSTSRLCLGLFCQRYIGFEIRYGLYETPVLQATLDSVRISETLRLSISGFQV